MSDAEAPRWQLRVSLDPGPDAPRVTVAVELRRTPSGGVSARIVMPDGKRVGSVLRREWLERRRHPADPAQRLCALLVQRGWMVWHVAPPSEPVPDDGRPPMSAIHAGRPRDLATELGALKFLAEQCPGAPVGLAREALVGGCDTGVTKICGPLTWWAITVRGTPSADLDLRLRRARYQVGREEGRPRYYWTDAPPDPVRRGRPTKAAAPVPPPSPAVACVDVAQPAASPPAAEVRPAGRGALRLVPPPEK